MRNVIVTGANSGLGFETAKKIAAQPGYRVFLACRNAEKAAAAQKSIVRDTGSQDVETLRLDTSSLASVRACAEGYLSRGEDIYALVNNAGISPAGGSGFTADGFEVVFETNYLGHFLLTNLLLSAMDEDGRILNVSSDMHNPPRGISWPGAEALAHPARNDRNRYSYSKLCMIYFTHSLDERLRGEGSKVTVNSFNPGFMADTNFSHGHGKEREAMVKVTMPNRYGTLAASSDALASLVTSEEVAGRSGEYFDRSTKAVRSSDLSYSKENAQELWDASLRFTGLA